MKRLLRVPYETSGDIVSTMKNLSNLRNAFFLKNTIESPETEVGRNANMFAKLYIKQKTLQHWKMRVTAHK